MKGIQPKCTNKKCNHWRDMQFNCCDKWDTKGMENCKDYKQDDDSTIHDILVHFREG